MSGFALDHFVVSLEKLAETDLRRLSDSGDTETSRQRALNAVRRIRHQLETPTELTRRIGWQEPAHVASIQVALKLGLLEELSKHSLDDEVTVHALAEATNVNEELAGRVMRHLASVGTVREIEENRYAATTTSNALLDPKVSNGIDFWNDISTRCFKSIPRFLTEDGYENLVSQENGVWQKASGTRHNLFKWLSAHSEELTGSSNYLAALRLGGRTQWTSIYPVKERLLEGSDSEGPLIVAVGGGEGPDIVAFQEEYSQPQGRLFVQDLPAVIEEANKKNADATIEFQEHDFFTLQPISGSRAYLLHYILRDWPDEKALEILAHLKEAMRRDYSKLLVAEFVVAAKDADPFTTALDITVMSCLGGKERTERDWRALFQKAGMEVTEIYSLPGNNESVMEVVPA